MESILTSIKKLLGLKESDTSFDIDIIFGINTALSVLTQIGVGPVNGFSITDKESKWVDFVPDLSKMEFLKSYVFLKTKLLFDPPSSSALVDIINKQILELEWRINVQAETREEII